MLRKWVSAAVIALILASAVVSADITTKTGSTDKAESTAQNKAAGQMSSSAAAGAPSYEYKDVEVHGACLQEYAYNNCQFEDTVLGVFDSELTCCHDKGYEPPSGDLGLSVLPKQTGQCSYMSFYLNPTVKVSPKVEKIATFIAQCQLNAHAEECGHPFCDKLTLTVQGAVYSIEDAIISSKPTSAALGTCATKEQSQAKCIYSEAKKKTANRVVARATHGLEGEQEPEPYYKQYGAQQEPEGYEPHNEAPYSEGPAHYQHQYEKPTLYKTRATVFRGPMTVNSRGHKVKYTQGWFEYVSCYDQDGATSVTQEEAGNAPILEPFKYKLSFHKVKSY